MTALAVIIVPTVEAALAELLERGYSLSVETRVEVHDHKVGAHPITYADRLLVAGSAPVPDHLRDTIIANKPLLLAAACILDPPTPWLRGLVARCKTGEKQAGCPIKPDVLAANIACFVGLDPVADAHKIDPVVQAML